MCFLFFLSVSFFLRGDVLTFKVFNSFRRSQRLFNPKHSKTQINERRWVETLQDFDGWTELTDISRSGASSTDSTNLEARHFHGLAIQMFPSALSPLHTQKPAAILAPAIYICVSWILKLHMTSKIHFCIWLLRTHFP